MTKKILKYILQAFIAAGIIAALMNFCNMSSLWWDEAMLSINIVNKSAGELLQPLDYKQVAPIAFLEAEKIIATFFNNTDWSLRIFPLISYLISIYLIYLLSFKIFKSKNLAFLASVILSLSYSTINYSAEVKQYMSDVLFTLIIIIFTLTITSRKNKEDLWIYALIGALSLWFSNTSIIILFPAGLYFLYNVYKQRKCYISAILVLLSWVISFAVYYYLFIQDHPTKPMMVSFWSRHNAFLPQNIFSSEFYVSLLEKMKELANFFPSYDRLYLGYVFIIVVGLVYLVKNKKHILFLLISPIVFHLILSYFKLYPFKGRLVLYLFPVIVLLFLSGMYYIFSFLNDKKYEFLKLFIIAPLFLIVTDLKKKLPVQKEELKRSMMYLDDNISIDDKIYVRYAAYAGFSFYKNNFPMLSKINNKQIIEAKGDGRNFKHYKDDILKQNDVWIVVTKNAFYRRNKDGILQKDRILNTFRDSGYEIVVEKNYKGSSVYKAVLVSKEKELQQEISR